MLKLLVLALIILIFIIYPVLRQLYKKRNTRKPYVGYQQIASSSLYVCHGCNGVGNTSIDSVIHLKTCLNYPSPGNRRIEAEQRAREVFGVRDREF